MNIRTLLASLACGALVVCAACQDDGITSGDDLTPSFSSVHLKGGKHATPDYTDLGIQLNASGSLSGMGNEDILVTIEAEADVVSVCQNQGGNEAPGQNPAPITVSGSQSIPSEEIKNGNVAFSVTTLAPLTPIPGAPDCPNPNWEEIIEDLIFTSATITVEQPLGTVVLMIYWP